MSHANVHTHTHTYVRTRIKQTNRATNWLSECGSAMSGCNSNKKIVQLDTFLGQLEHGRLFNNAKASNPPQLYVAMLDA